MINQLQKQTILILVILYQKLIITLTKQNKKTDYNTKVTNIENKLNDHNHDKYTDTSNFNTVATNFSNARLTQANLITKTDFDAKSSNLNRKIT